MAAQKDFLYKAYKADLITLIELQAWGREALAKIRSGSGKTLSGWSIGGKSFSAQVTMTPEELLESVAYAVQSVNEETTAGASVSTLYATFSGS